MVEPRFLIQLRKPDAIEVCSTDVPMSSVCKKISECSTYTCAQQAYCAVTAALITLPLGDSYNAYTSSTGVVIVTKTTEDSSFVLNTGKSIRYRPLPPSDDEGDTTDDEKKDPTNEAYITSKLICLRNMDAVAKWIFVHYTMFLEYINQK